ncbi:hypothetical protein [Streptomyces sp. NPDC003480]
MTDEVGAVIEETEPAVLVGGGMREDLRSGNLSTRLMRPDSA